LFLLLRQLQAKIQEIRRGFSKEGVYHNDRPGLGNLIELFPIEMAKTLRVLALMSDSKS